VGDTVDIARHPLLCADEAQAFVDNLESVGGRVSLWGNDGECPPAE
jgi:hypothetical protein